MKNALLLIVIVALAGCSTNKHSIFWSHPNYPENTEYEKSVAQNAMNRDWSTCKQLAYQNVHKPRNADKARVYTPPPISNSSHVDYGSYTRGVKTANRPDPYRVYQNNIRQYFYSCVQSRGWSAHQQ